jgi:hypothetical protein
MLLYRKLLAFALALFCLQVQAQDSTKPSPRKTFKNLTNPDSLVLINFKIIPVPTISSTPETGVKFGGELIHFFNAKGEKKESRGSFVIGQMSFSTKSQFEIGASWQAFTKNEKFVFRGSAGYTNFNERYWGLGNNTLSNDNYYSQFYTRTFLESRNFRLIANQWYVGAVINYSNTFNVTYSRPLDANQLGVTGINGSQVFGVGPAVLYEGRNYPFSATKGSYFEFYLQHYDKLLGGDYVYNEWLLDMRKYIPLQENSTLAFQLFTRESIGDIPLRETSRLGSANLMRGFFVGRFRDNAYSASQIELRSKIWKWIYGAVFGATGLVGESVGKYDISNIRSAGGAGLRFLVNKKNRMFLRVDYARNSTGGNAYYIKLNEAF